MRESALGGEGGEVIKVRKAGRRLENHLYNSSGNGLVMEVGSTRLLQPVPGYWESSHGRGKSRERAKRHQPASHLRRKANGSPWAHCPPTPSAFEITGRQQRGTPWLRWEREDGVTNLNRDRTGEEWGGAGVCVL